MNRRSQKPTAAQPESAFSPPTNNTHPVRRLGRRVGLGLGSTIAMFGLATTFASSALADNTAQSSTGAFLQSSGRCEGGQYNLTVDSQNFEYLTIGVVTPAGNTTWTDWAPAPQNAYLTVPLPTGRRGLAYIVAGADNVAGQWEITTVTTSFNFILDGNNYSNNWC